MTPAPDPQRLPARLAAALRTRRPRPRRAPRVHVARGGAEPLALPPDDARARALVAAAEALLSAAQRDARG